MEQVQPHLGNFKLKLILTKKNQTVEYISKMEKYKVFESFQLHTQVGENSNHIKTLRLCAPALDFHYFHFFFLIFCKSRYEKWCGVCLCPQYDATKYRIYSSVQACDH